MPTSGQPQAPPRNKKPVTKRDISEPYDFQHVGHVGLDFKPEDVKNAILPRNSPTGRQQSTQSDHIYESVQRQQETPILSPASPRDEMPPPTEFAPEYVSSGVSTTSVPVSSSLNTVPPAPVANKDITDYENRPSPHIYQNIAVYKDRPRPSRKKHPPPPPPQENKPKLTIAEEPAPSVAFRTQISVPKTNAPEEPPAKNETPKRIEASPVSVVIERPGMLGEMTLGLDDPIPLMTGIPSKYRSPSMLTPKEMAVDVPIPHRSPGIPAEIHSPKKEEAPRPPLTKEAAVDVPSTPAATSTAPTLPIIEHENHKRPAPSPPAEPDAPPRGYQPYTPVGVSKVPPQMKNVISELKTRQSKDEEEEIDEGHEYVSLSQYKRVSVEDSKLQKGPTARDPTTVPVKELDENVLKLQESKEDAREAAPGPKIPVPVPRPRKTARSVDLKDEDTAAEPVKSLEKIPEAAEIRGGSSHDDDGIDTGIDSDDDEVIRL